MKGSGRSSRGAMRASARRSRIDSRARSIRPVCSDRRPPCAVFWWLKDAPPPKSSGFDERDRQSARRRVGARWSGRGCRRRRRAVVNAVGRPRPRSRARMRKYSIVSRHPAPIARMASDNSAVRDYWNHHIHDLEITTHPVGQPGLFRRSRSVPLREAAPPAPAGRLRRLPRPAGARSGLRRGDGPVAVRKGGAEVTGVDLSSSAIALARENFASAGADGRFARSGRRAAAVSPTTRSISSTRTASMQYTGGDPRRSCDECRRVLKPGGTAVFQVYNRVSWLNALSKVMKVPLEHEDAPVLRKYSAGEFRALLGGVSRRAASSRSGSP